jgi:hypothetical protein
MYKKIIIISFLSLLIIILFSIFSKKTAPEKINKIDQVTTNFEEKKEIIATVPNKYLISLPFVEQAPEKNWDQPWQDACEEASLLTVQYFYQDKKPNLKQIKNDILSLIDYENKNEMTESINISQMSILSRDYLSLKSKIIENPTINQLKEYISQNIPVIVPTSGKILFKENKHFNDGGPYYHNVVLVGYDDSKKQFIVHDVGTKSGKNFHYSYDLLIDSIHDFPDSNKKEDINNGQKRVLILLK